jgi:7-cyano-7-deazaguanine reductase
MQKNIYLFPFLHKLNYRRFLDKAMEAEMTMKKYKQARGKNKAFAGLTILRQSIQRYPASPEEAKLETFANAHPGRDYWIHIECPEFTALCPLTGQPDFACIIIDYIPDQLCLESKSVKFYLHSFRNTGTFHEEAVNRILDDMVKACRPRRMKVIGRFNPRGGIAITVSAEHP